jgi:hypothetical protein
VLKSVRCEAEAIRAEDPSTVTSLNNLAVVLHGRGEQDELGGCTDKLRIYELAPQHRHSH